ncbi:hypothetical protein BDV93DRAFT_608748 [Ceratobasidium sp. AG-I]|nr:hypothetical protein BDV93DRAFT_608748 [Ceratobasidium sp. AG-I]
MVAVDLYCTDGNCYAPGPTVPYSAGVLRLFHPGYPGLTGFLLLLPRLDLVPESNPAQYGVHYGTLMMICYIITGNRLGFLSSIRLSGSEQVPSTPPPTCAREFDDVLTEEYYYYYIYGISLEERYPVLHDFESWSFPDPDELRTQPLWSKWNDIFNLENTPINTLRLPPLTDVSAQVKARDDACQLTGAMSYLGCRAAHVVPANQVKWFDDNAMYAYDRSVARNANGPTRSSNMFVLRNDLHFIFDAQYFTFVPKEGKLLVHILNPDSGPACVLHNSKFHDPKYLSAHYFLARLAWTVLPLVKPFNTKKKLEREAIDDLGLERTAQRRNRGPISDLQGSNPGSQASVDDSRGDDNAANERDSLVDEYDSATDEDSSTVDEDEELAREEEKAKRYFPDVFTSPLLGSDLEADPTIPTPRRSLDHLSPERARTALYDINTLTWYPGAKRVKRLEKKWLKANPQVRETVSAEVATSDVLFFESSPEL